MLADQRLEQTIADLVRHRREADELQVGEPGLEHEVGPHRELDRIGPQQQLVDRWRAAIATQLSVWKNRCVQSNCWSQATSGCMSRSGICVWRSSSSAPNLAAVRQAPWRPKRAARRFPITAANSASGRVASCSFSPQSQVRRRPLEVP